MVQGAVADTSKKLHPFFVKGAAESPTPATERDDSASDAGEGDDDDRKKRRQTDTSLPQDAPEAKKQRRRRKNGGGSLDGSILNHLSKPAAAPSHPSDDATNAPTSDFPTPPLSDVSVKPPDAPQPAPVPPEAQPTTPAVPSKAKKVLKFNPKTGTLGSPPKPKSKGPASRIVSIKYGRDGDHRREVGDKITQILEGKWRVPATPTKKRLRVTKNVNYAIPEAEITSKVTHPFFSGKPKPQPEPAKTVEPPKKKRDSVFMSTPVSPRKSRAPFNVNADKLPQFGMKSTGTKIPGAMLPLWPALGMSHVRGDDAAVHAVKANTIDGPLPRKFKGQIVRVPPEESTLSRLAYRLDLGRVRNTLPRNHDTFEPAPAELRVPQRHFESGRKLQRKIRSQLRTYCVHTQSLGGQSSQDELSGDHSARVHPAIIRLYDSLESQLSAYDRSTCESLTWTQKYAPCSADQVLQAGKEGNLLRQWLKALKVQSVDTGDASGKSKGKAEGVTKKKRKKNKLDGFVVDSDDEANEMDEVSEDEADWGPAGPGRLNKTVVRSGNAYKGKEQVRLTNTVVLSGPHGCGKTAAVYAVAKELGFEVFEINSSTRRSGKDILEKVGDMTRNHLVQQHRAEGHSEASVDDEVDQDIKSGKQGMMTAFFKPKPERVQAPKTQPKGKLEEEAKSSAPKAQKQSLILLEEVDILYEEDKQFWATLMTLIVQSKRPFIMTCNDESLVPLQTLSLHGIFRFSPPPVDLAVDLCLLIAANEGHALQRSAVKALYDSRENDLRATITDLNYWCQLGVGDRRGGFDWFYLRWPRGSDLDENGDVVRVVSENTYTKGMGWLGRDSIGSTPDRLEIEEEAMRQSWGSWQLDMGDWDNTLDLKSWAEAQSGRDPKTKLPTLEAYDEFCESMSDADVCSCAAFGLGLQEKIDPTLPDIPSKARDDFIIGRALLEATPLVRPNCPSLDMSICLQSLARSDLLGATNNATDTASVLDPVNEDKAVSILDSSFHASPRQLTRYDLSIAFDPIAVSDKPPSGTLLDPSVLDRTLALIVLDVAPWVRGIVQFDHRLMQDRLKLSSLLSEGGSGKRKRMRTTRSAYSALEGGERRTTRRERYFGDKLVTGLVMRTAGEAWQDAIPDVVGVEETPTVEGSTAEGSLASGDEMLVGSP